MSPGARAALPSREAHAPASRSPSGLNRLEVAVASLHALTLGCLSAGLVVGTMSGSSLRLLDRGVVPPSVSFFLGAIGGWAILLLVQAANRSPRAALSKGDRWRLELSGLVLGLVGVPLFLSQGLGARL